MDTAAQVGRASGKSGEASGAVFLSWPYSMRPHCSAMRFEEHVAKCNTQQEEVQPSFCNFLLLTN